MLPFDIRADPIAFNRPGAASRAEVASSAIFAIRLKCGIRRTEGPVHIVSGLFRFYLYNLPRTHNFVVVGILVVVIVTA